MGPHNMMETGLDYHPFSPAFQNLRHTAMHTGKRARDSETDDNESIDGRPLKRPFLTVGSSSSSHDSVNSSRQGSEDWVYAAGGLSIDSPHYTPAILDHGNPFAAEGGSGRMEEDTDMLVENEATTTAETRTPLQLHHMSYDSQPPQEVAPMFTSNSEQHTPRRHNYGTRYAERLHGNSLPLIDIRPATPVNTTSQTYEQQYFGHHLHPAYSQADTQGPPLPPQILASMPMSLSQNPAESAPGGKRRIAFGPRANCEKCRLRIPGHFVHFD